MNKRDSAKFATLVGGGRVPASPGNGGYLRAVAASRGGRGKTLERLVASEQQLPNCPVVLTQVRQEAFRTKAGWQPKKGPCDFFGVVRETGQAIVFDAKECTGPSFDCSDSAVKPHQINELVRHGRGGAIAGLLILDVLGGWIHWLDWTRVVTRHATYQWDSLPICGDARYGVYWDSLVGIVGALVAAAPAAGGGTKE